MPEPTGSKPGPFGRILRKRAGPGQIVTMSALRKQEMEAGFALMRARQRAELREQLWSRLRSYWPIGVGLFLGALAPVLQVAATSIGHWCMVLVFPFVVLASRPEIQAGGPITHALPAVMLFAQFPLEGLLAWFILRSHVKFSSVVMQVFLFHFLGIFELLLLSGRLHRPPGR